MGLGAVGGSGLGLVMFANGLLMMTLAITSLAVALEQIPEGKTVALKTLNDTLTTAKTITEDNIKPTKDFIGVVKDYYEVQANSKDSDKDALVAALREVLGEQNKAAQESAGGEMPIKLVISGDEFARAINSNGASVSGILTGPTSFKRRGG